MSYKKGWVASILNFLTPGMGYLYGRNVKKAVGIYISFFIVLLSIRFLSYSFVLLSFSLLIVLLFYLYMIINGYRAVDKNKNYHPSKFDKWYIYLVIIILHWFFANKVYIPNVNKISPINFAYIPTPSMSPALEVGDMIAYKRNKSLSNKDLMIFYYPKDYTNTMYIQRCIAIPGDTLEIKDQQVFINNERIPSDFALKYSYSIIPKNKARINPKFFKKYKIDDFFRMQDNNYFVHLTEDQARILKSQEIIEDVSSITFNQQYQDIYLFPQNENIKWTLDNFGPIFIPKKGDTVILNEKNLIIYGEFISFWDNQITLKNDGLYINNQKIEKYTFSKDCYFGMGDNRHNAVDSRTFGFIPENLVLGKAMYIYWSESQERIGMEVK